MLEVAEFGASARLPISTRQQGPYLRDIASDAARAGIVEDILEGREAAGLRLPMLIQGVPVEWDRQHQLGSPS
jgi:hypothetical protein